MPQAGSPEFLKQSLSSRTKAYDIARFSSGGEAVPMNLYFTQKEIDYIQARSKPTGKWVEEIIEKYPTYAGYLNIPEIGNVLREATEKGWQPAEILNKLSETTWWQTHSPDQRNWFLLNQTDPAAAAQSLMNQQQEVVRAASKYGLHVNPHILTGLATAALSNGWDDERVVEELIKLQANTGDEMTGLLGATYDDLKAVASDYIVPLSDKALTRWTRQVTTGKQTQEGFEAYLRDQAKSMFKDQNMHAALDGGMTVREYADPYVQLAAQTLNLNPATIDLTEGRWRRALQFKDEAGDVRSMTLDEWGDSLRTDRRYGYDFTDNARNEAAGFATSILEKFGRM